MNTERAKWEFVIIDCSLEELVDIGDVQIWKITMRGHNNFESDALDYDKDALGACRDFMAAKDPREIAA